MLKKAGWLSVGLTLAAFSVVASFAPGSMGSAQAAVVYCKTAGVPQGCVVRPTPVVAAAVVTPPVGVARVGVTRVGVTRVGVGARGVGVRPGTPMNRGGPVNRVGRR
jgi:hypothetical protein